MSNMSTETPWTSIILLNEEFFLAKEEEIKMRNSSSEHVLPKLTITRIKGRKFQFPKKREWCLLSGQPYERYRVGDLKHLEIKYDTEYFPTIDFNIQDQVRSDRERGLDAVFIDELEIMLDIYKGKAPFFVGYTLTVIPRNSQTHREVKARVREYKRRYGLYENMLTKEYKRKMLETPSCLEASYVFSGIPKSQFRPVNVTDKYLNGRTETSIQFLCTLTHKTNWVINCAYKVPSVREGMVLDGIIKELPFPPAR